MSRFKQVLHSRDVNRSVNYNIYVTGSLNLLLWGSETWNLTKANLKKIKVFRHSTIRWILGIKWEKMKEERITNDEVRTEFNNIPPVEDFIGRHTLRFLGKIVRTNDRQIQKKMLNAWIPTSRKSGAPQKTLRHRLKTTIKIVLPGVENKRRCPSKGMGINSKERR